MSETTAHLKIERGSARNFGIVFAVVFLVIAAFPYVVRGEVHIWPLVVAGVFAMLALVKPAVLEPLNVLWFKFGMLLGAIVAPLVMMAIYFLVVTPIGILMRLARKDPLLLKRNHQQTTYWIKRTTEQSSSMKNQF